MEHMESKMQDYYDAGEAKLKHACEVVEKVKQFCEENRMNINDVHNALDVFRKMGWEL